MRRFLINTYSLKPRKNSDQGRRGELDGRFLHRQQSQVVLPAFASVIARIVRAAR